MEGKFKNLGKMMIGIDGGGSKTEFILFSEDGIIRKRLLLGGSNLGDLGKEAMCCLLRSGIDKLLAETMEVSGIFIGASGVTSAKQGEEIVDILKQSYPDIDIWCDTDIVNIIAGQIDSENCIVAICGTGVIVYACENGRLQRFGGWGYLLEKGGSGYNIGRDALQTALEQRDGMNQESRVTALVEERLGMPVWECIHEIYRQGQGYIASFAPIVFSAFEERDNTARKILEYHAGCLGELISYAKKACPAANKVVLSGSVISKSRSYQKMLEDRLPAGLSMTIAEYPQVYGACIMCCKLCNIDLTGIHKNFLSQYFNM